MTEKKNCGRIKKVKSMQLNLMGEKINAGIIGLYRINFCCKFYFFAIWGKVRKNDILISWADA